MIRKGCFVSGHAHIGARVRVTLFLATSYMMSCPIARTLPAPNYPPRTSRTLALQMPLDNASDAPASDMDPFGSSDSGDQMAGSDNPYPKFTPLAPFSRLLGYTEHDRQRYISLQSNNTARLLKLELTPLERAGLAYYDSIFYTYESYGDLFGTSAGLAIGYMLRNRRAGPIARGLSRFIGQGANPRAANYVAAALRLVVFGSAGRLYGLASAGLQGLNRMRAEQSQDPVMSRIVGARAARSGALEREVNMRRRTLGLGGGDDDAQSLGGMEMADQVRLGDEAAARERSAAFPFGKPSEVVVEMEKRRETLGEDPFAAAITSATDGKAPEKAWQNNHSNTAESSWERLRRGKPPAEALPQQTRGGGSGVGEVALRAEPKTDGFGWDPEKTQAQKEFDEGVERERRIGTGDGYSEGDQGGKKWKD